MYVLRAHVATNTKIDEKHTPDTHKYGQKQQGRYHYLTHRPKADKNPNPKHTQQLTIHVHTDKMNQHHKFKCSANKLEHLQYHDQNAGKIQTIYTIGT